MTAKELVDSDRWLSGPDFLQTNAEWPSQPSMICEPYEAEIKREVKVYNTYTVKGIEKLISYYSNYYSLCRAVAWLLRLKEMLRKRLRSISHPLTVHELKIAEYFLLQYVQTSSISEAAKTKQFKKLKPITNKEGLICVGGRLDKAPLLEAQRHPILLPAFHPVSNLIIQYYHDLSGHSGAERTLAETRQRYWIIKGRVMTKALVFKCIKCRKSRASFQEQVMADLPVERITPYEAPFTNVGVDYFGPIQVKRGRCEIKRYGCLFTCMATRAIHLEVACNMETDSFINALQRFIARRGEPQQISSDNGTNFVGARRELRAMINSWNKKQIHEFLLQKEVSWVFNPPTASHMGGVWERLIRSVRSIILSLLSQQPLTDEGLSTLFCTIESVVNGRPLTKLSDDPTDLLPLTPNHLLILRPGKSLPIGVFSESDKMKRTWRQVQYLADVFWKRWLTEYLPSLQSSRKWLKPRPNLKPGDLVLVKQENTPRFSWPLGVIRNVFPGNDNKVRVVELKTKTGIYKRPIHKLCLLEAA